MIELLYRRIISNKWLFICLLTGALCACGIFAAIPMYSNAILQKVLTKDLENYHAERNISPGKYSVFVNTYKNIGWEKAKQVESTIERQLHTAYNLPVECVVKEIVCSPSFRLMRDGDEYFNQQRNFVSVVFLSEYEDHIKIVNGRIPDNKLVNGIYEVAVSQEGMKEKNFLLNNIYSMVQSDFLSDENIQEVARFKVVGVYTIENNNDLYWSGGRYGNQTNSVIINQELIDGFITSNDEMKFNKIEWTYFFDYYAVKIDDIQNIFNTEAQQERWREKNGYIVSIEFPITEVLESYGQRQKQLTITLWILIVPLMILICFYTLMISRLIIKNDKNEIAVLKSRGAGKFQIFLIYVIESIVLSGISFAAGPYIGYMICRILGSSNGFLEFVNRKALVLNINFEVYMYSFVAASIFTLFMLAPALKASTISIVQYKRSRLSGSSKSLWQRFYLDIVILGISIYGLYSFRNRQDILGLTGLGGTELNVDPLLFFISTFFILGVSLVFLRVYPLIMRAIFNLGRKWWNPVFYFSLVNISRAGKNLQFIMLFIILSLSFGIINANQARTINSNTTDRIMYNTGADVVIEPYNNLKHIDNMSMMGMPQIGTQDEPEEYIEPRYEEYKKIKGIESITKVLVNDKAVLTRGKERVTGMQIMGIIPHEFAKTAWFRQDLLQHHINEYVNLLTMAPRAVLLSSSIGEEYDIKKGDNVYIRWGDGNTLEFTVYAFIDYFPSCNPYSEKEKGKKNHFAIFNYSYITSKLPVQPYEIWVKKQPGTPDGTINEELEAKNLSVERVDYANQDIINKKNDPMLLGTNGVLTMCFLVTMLITAIGFIIFWVLSIRERALKFGIFRAIGMPMRNITLIIACEQVLVSGCAILAGILVGSAASIIFIPLLQIVYASWQQVPPFRIIAYRSDYVKVLGMTLVMLITGLSFLYWLVRRINIHQVLKLGED